MSKTDIDVTKSTKTSYRTTYVSRAWKPYPNSSWNYEYTTSTQSGTRTLYRRKRTSAVTPGFYTHKGALPVNGFYFLLEDNPIAVGSFKRTRPETTSTAGYNSTEWYDGMFVPGPPPPTMLIDGARVESMKRHVSMKIRNKLKDQKINLAQAAAERVQTANTIADSARSIAESIIKLKRGDFAGAARAVGISTSRRAGRRFRKNYASDQSSALANGWLSLQYGWKPLLSDVYGACEVLANTVNTRVYGAVKSSTRATEQKAERKNSLGADCKGTSVDYTDITHEVDVRMGVVYSISSSEVANLKELGITNPALLAWELLPYSFVVDWFLPIGSWLSSMDATLGLTFESGYTTVCHKITSFGGTEQSYLYVPRNETTHQRGLRTYKKFEVKRTALSSFPQASFPSFQNPVSLTRMGSALALLRQSFKR